jgi:Ran GTPase-activating protein (RanGAP) involved in mRNA processing and transport
MGSNCGKEFAEMLSENNTLKTLVLQENQLSDDEATHLAQGLRNNLTLACLDLSNNHIGDIGAAELGSGISLNTSLRELNISWNHTRFAYLLVFIHRPRGVNSFFSNLQSNNSLNLINIDSNGVGDSGQCIATYLQKTNSLTFLSLSRTRLTDAGSTAISKGIENSSMSMPFNY